ncbi:DUF1641 domain-containing protein [Halobacillus amylolyticus]|uniref:DUF1641 domain-containing protein n=1 Tax=Halobacillus amylolyticus TaxID=2932259 RepID=A0ABY4HA65_9BACI|nr:DUF1641 domain-containing protein [Halobacillus amylolyticus]UOR11753.1 DUF1641 domain-containing protein [Halobacillus amylolyticus]
MAKAIRQIDKSIPTPEQEQAQDLEEILGALAKNRESLLILLEIVEELHKSGLLDIAKGMLKTRHKLGVLAMDELDKPAVHDLVKSGISTFNFLTKINSDQLDGLLDGVSSGLEESSKSLQTNEKVGMWGLMKSINDPDINRSITTLLGFLQGMGQGLKTKEDK